MSPYRQSPTATLGIDFGTGSVRAVVVDCHTGSEWGQGEASYSHGIDGVIGSASDRHLSRQHVSDYLDGLHSAVRGALDTAEANGFDRRDIVGIGVGTTGSTPLPVDATGWPLVLDPRFEDELAAMAWLWKDHTAYAEAEEITAGVAHEGLPYLGPCGGIYSSEWYWAKLARFLRTAPPDLIAATRGWVELADFIPGYLVDHLDPATMGRGICPAGHKALYDETWGGLPTAVFLEDIQPGMSSFRYTTRALASDRSIGRLRTDIASSLGLRPGIAVAAGAFDAHLGAVGAGVEEGVLVKIVGTSTCDTTVVAGDRPLIEGLCGSVPDSIIPGMVGLEAGQSAVGDIFAWFTSSLSPGPSGAGTRIEELTADANRLRPGSSGLLGLDWQNGNRSVLVDPLLSGLMVGMNLATTAPEFYRALIESTAFGAQRIIEQFESRGVPINRLVLTGGIVKKNPLLVRIYADVTNRPIEIAGTDQTCAVGAAILASVAAGVHASTEQAQVAMVPPPEHRIDPDPSAADVYSKLYRLYLRLHDAFGTPGVSDLSEVMKQLLAIQRLEKG